MTGVAFGGLHDDGAAIEADGHIGAAFGDGEAGAFAHFYVRAVVQAEDGVGIAGGADVCSGVHFCAADKGHVPVSETR